MKNIYFLLFGFILLFGGCTKNNQNTPSSFAYLNVNQTYTRPGGGIATYQSYDIDNDGQTDWCFEFAGDGYIVSNGCLYASYVTDSVNNAKTLSSGFNINSSLNFRNNIFFYGQDHHLNSSVAGAGDYYIGFKSQNPTYTNSFYGWARLNISADGMTLIVKDMAMNTVNGGSINVGQH